MKIYLTSDIHTEMAQYSFNPLFDYECLRFDYPDEADVIVLSGDIGQWVNGLEWAANKFKGKNIVYVAGNHEYYNLELSIIEEIRVKAVELGIHFLEQNEVIIDGVRFLGCTLWTNLNQYRPDTVTDIWGYLNDYRYIYCKKWWDNKQNKAQALWLMDLETRYGFDPEFFSPTVSYLLHRQNIQWLNNKLIQKFSGKTVVVTHHAPTLRSTNDFAYGSNLENFISQHSQSIDVWMHGHIHQPADYNIDGVRILSNPRGYPTNVISDGFKENKLICL